MKKIITITLVLIIILGNLNIGFCDDIDLKENLTALMIAEYDTGEILYEYNINKKIEIASITKLMTYLVAMDVISSTDISMDDIVNIGINPTKVGGATFRLYKGEKVKLETLLDAIIIVSGNDACVAIAEYITGSEEEFVKMMNEKAKTLGIKSAVYYNSSGMPIVTKEGKKIQNMMNVNDIFKLSRHIISKYPQILEMTDRTEIDIIERQYYRENKNPLLKEIPLVDGLKTGYTDKAGYCLVSTLRIPKNDENDQSFRIISIAMGAKSELESKEINKKIINYVMDNYKKEHILSKNVSLSELEIVDAVNPNLKVFPKDDIFKIKKLGDTFNIKLELNEKIIPPISKGEKVGKVLINHNDKIQEVDVIVKRDVKKADFFTRLFRVLQNFVLKINIGNLFGR